MPAEPRAKYMASYEERLATPANRESNDPISQLALQRLVATVRSHGAIPIFVVPPTTEAGYFYPPMDREKDLAILDFSDVRKYPELYDPNHRIDLDHLNTAGAKIFSEALAQDFVPMVNRTQGNTMIKSLACVCCFFAGLVLASLAIGRCLPFPDVPGIRQKLDWLARHGDDFDVVFLGSSRVEQQIIPEEFDHAAASLGHPVRSFNAGMAAMVPAGG